MELFSRIFSVTEIIGVVAASISGSMIAVVSSFDLFGVIFCGILTALGGGVIRDILIGCLPPRSFHNAAFLVSSLVTSVIVFVILKILHSKKPPRQELLHKVFVFFDAIGLASFSIGGVQIGMASEYSGNAFLCVFLGMTTAIGGGILRDLMTARRPLVLCKEIYATASLIGCIAYYFSVYLGLPVTAATPLCMILIVLIRLLAFKFRWNMREDD